MESCGARRRERNQAAWREVARISAVNNFEAGPICFGFTRVKRADHPTFRVHRHGKREF